MNCGKQDLGRNRLALPIAGPISGIEFNYRGERNHRPPRPIACLPSPVASLPPKNQKKTGKKSKTGKRNDCDRAWQSACLLPVALPATEKSLKRPQYQCAVREVIEKTKNRNDLTNAPRLRDRLIASVGSNKPAMKGMIISSGFMVM